jgi:hypothetical protein
MAVWGYRIRSGMLWNIGQREWLGISYRMGNADQKKKTDGNRADKMFHELILIIHLGDFKVILVLIQRMNLMPNLKKKMTQTK